MAIHQITEPRITRGKFCATEVVTCSRTMRMRRGGSCPEAEARVRGD